MEASIKTDPLLSIILPVYNVGFYVEDCLKSIFSGNVSESDFEVIVVNDGSTDDSMQFVEPFASLHGNITIVNQENQGLSSARMAGLSKALGKYVWFIDSDDWLVPEALTTVFGILSTHLCDVLVAPLQWSYDDISKNHLDFAIDSPMLTEGKKVLTDEVVPVWAAPRYIIDKSLFQNPFLVFPKGLLHEDEYFGRVLLALAGRAYVYDKPLYYYRQRESSIMRTISIRSSYDIVSVYDRLIRFADTLPEKDRGWFSLHCQRLLVKSYTINRDKWGSPEFRAFKRKNQFHILSEYVRLHKTYSGKELFILFFLTLSPVAYGKHFPKKQ